MEDFGGSGETCDARKFCRSLDDVSTGGCSVDLIVACIRAALGAFGGSRFKSATESVGVPSGILAPLGAVGAVGGAFENRDS